MILSIDWIFVAVLVFAILFLVSRILAVSGREVAKAA